MNKIAIIALLATTMAAGTAAFPLAANAQDLQADRSGPYVGAAVGTTVNNDRRVDLGARAGWQFGPHLRTEAEYGNSFQHQAANSLKASIVAQYRIPSTSITPYAHVGTGFVVQNGATTAIYSAGAGARLAVARNVELDARYSYTGAFDTGTHYPKAGTNSFTLGANFRF